jgi:hypothetical protein
LARRELRLERPEAPAAQQRPAGARPEVERSEVVLGAVAARLEVLSWWRHLRREVAVVRRDAAGAPSVLHRQEAPSKVRSSKGQASEVPLSWAALPLVLDPASLASAWRLPAALVQLAPAL